MHVRWLGLPLILVLALGCGGQSSSDGASGSAGASATGGGGSGGVGGVSGIGGVGGGPSGFGGDGGGPGGMSGTAGSGGAAPECLEDSQCALFSDCCTCAAYGPGEEPPPACFATCDQDQCTSLGVTQPSCAAGQCVAGFDCSSPVLCNMAPPQCPSGQVPMVLGGCWGPCVDATQCRSVPGCAACTGAQQICVHVEAQTGPTLHCVDIPEGCEAQPFCQCMGPSVCIQPYDVCTDFSGIKGLSCSCPTC